MTCLLTHHHLGYTLSNWEKSMSALTLTNIPYATRHIQLAACTQRVHWFGHIVLAFVECIPVIGLMVSAIEYIVRTMLARHNNLNFSGDPSHAAPVLEKASAQTFLFKKLPFDVASQMQNFLSVKETSKSMHRTCKAYQHLWGNNGHLDLSDVGNIGTEDMFRIIDEFQARGGRITSINLQGQQIGVAMIELLANLTRLKRLDLSDTNIDNESLAHLAHLPLEWLDISRTQVSDEGLAHLAKMPLKSLKLIHLNHLTDAGLAHLAHLPLESLGLNSNYGITGTGFKHIAQLPLKYLAIPRCHYLIEANLADLTPLKSQLEFLDLSETAITDDGLAQLAPFELSRLQVDNCMNITEMGLARVAGLLPAVSE